MALVAFHCKGDVMTIKDNTFKNVSELDKSIDQVIFDPAMLKQLEAMLPISERPKKVAKDVPLTAVGKDTKQKKVA